MSKANNNTIINFEYPIPLSNKIGIPYSNNNYLLTLDALSLNLKPLGNDIFNFEFIKNNFNKEVEYFRINSDFKIKKNSNLEKNYLNSFHVFYKSELVGELSTDCRIGSRREYVKFKFDNSVFYTKKNWLRIQNELEIAFNLNLIDYSFFHIAYDSHNKYDRYMELYHNSTKITHSYHDATYRPTNKVTISTLIDNGEIAIGSKNEKVIGIYNKSLELDKNKNKSYISDAHKANGLDINQQIDRIEVRAWAKYTKKQNYKITLEILATPEGLASVFKSLTEHSLSYFDLRTKHSVNGNVKYTRIDLIDFSQFKAKELVKVAASHTTGLKTNRNVKTAFRVILNNHFKGSVSIESLNDFIKDDNNSLDLADNLGCYRKIVRQAIKDYTGNPTPETIELMGNIESDLFNSTHDIGIDNYPELEYSEIVPYSNLFSDDVTHYLSDDELPF